MGIFCIPNNLLPQTKMLSNWYLPIKRCCKPISISFASVINIILEMFFVRGLKQRHASSSLSVYRFRTLQENNIGGSQDHKILCLREYCACNYNPKEFLHSGMIHHLFRNRWFVEPFIFKTNYNFIILKFLEFDNQLFEHANHNRS